MINSNLLANHSGGVDGGQAEIHIGCEHSRLVLVLGLETTCRGHSWFWM